MKMILVLISALTLTTNAIGQQYKRVLIDNSLDYLVENEGSTYESVFKKIVESENGSETISIIDTVKADLLVDYFPKKKDDDEQIIINSSSAEIRGDTLELVIYNHGFQFIWEYRISIVNDNYLIDSWFIPPTLTKKIELDPILTFLSVNALSYKKGDIIKGHTKMNGKCSDSRGCFSKNIIIEGDFRATVK